MNDLKKIYQRLQANYPEGDWEITLEGERLSIRLERAQVVVEGEYILFLIAEDAQAGVEAFQAGVETLAQ